MKYYLSIFLLLPFVASAGPKDKMTLDSLLNEFSLPRYQKNDTNRARMLYNISQAYQPFSVDSGIYYANQCLALSQKIGYVYGRGVAYERLGRYYSYSNFNKGLEYYFKFLKVFEDAHDNTNIAWAYNILAGPYFNAKNFARALEYFQKSKEYAEKAGDLKQVMGAEHNIAATYTNMGNHKKALEHLFTVLKYFQSTGNNDITVYTLINIASNYSSLKEYNKALVYAAAAIRLRKNIGIDKLNAEFAYGEVLRYIGTIYFSIYNDPTAKIVADSLMPATRGGMLKLAVKYFNEAIKINEKEKNVDPDALEQYSEVLAASGDYKKAMEILVRAVRSRDSIYSITNQLKAADQAVQRERDLRENQAKINKLQALKTRNSMVSLIIGICLLLIITFIVIRNYRRQKAANQKLAAEKERSDKLTFALQDSLEKKNQLTEQLEVSAAMKSKFLANISHELRTPVTLLTGMLELLKSKNGDSTDGNREKLAVAYNNSRKLQYMVEEILDLSKLEGGEARLDSKPAELAPLLKRMVYAFETFIQKEHLTLNYSENGLAGLFVTIDENKFEKVINNLIYNAIKFNEKGGWIKVDAETTADNRQVVIHVSNSGGGISPKDLPHIFERFYQGDTSKAKAEGAGIGLSLVKEFTLLMGGTIDVSGDGELGTTFTLQFPISTKKAIEIKEEEALPELLQEWKHFPVKPKVLLVEDNKEMRYYLQEVLGDKVKLAEAANGKEALDRLQQDIPDLIISDIMMPEMDGREFVNILKNEPAYKKIPVITLTALADKTSQVEMLRLGIDDYIVKPFDATELSVRVYNLLNNVWQRKQFAEQPAEPDDIPSDSKEADELRSRIRDFVLSRISNLNISVYDLAYELAVSERQLYRLAKNLTGCTAAQLIKEVRLQKAYELLLSGDIYKIEDVARRVGFETPAYFSKVFLERFGKRPTEFL